MVKRPTGMATSCKSVTMAIIPYFQDETGLETFLKAKAMKQIIASEMRTTAITAFLVSSRPTEGPIELKFVSVRALALSWESVCKSKLCSKSFKLRDFTI